MENGSRKKLSSSTISTLLLFPLCLYAICYVVSAEENFENYPQKFSISGLWEIGESETLEGQDRPEGIKLGSRSFFVHKRDLPETSSRITYTAGLNLRYFSGITYNYLQENLPGKSLSLNVHIPASLVSDFRPIPNRLRVLLKSSKDNMWTEYSEGGEWTNLNSEGIYPFSIEIPSEDTLNRYGGVFHPDHTTLVSVELHLMEGSKRHSCATFGIFDLEIEGLDLNENKLQWQLLNHNTTGREMFLPSFPGESVFFYNIGQKISLSFYDPCTSLQQKGLSETLKRGSITVPVFIPKELRSSKAFAELTVTTTEGKTLHSKKNFDSTTAEGRIYLTVPFENLSFSAKEISCSIELEIRLHETHLPCMMPFVIEPVIVKQGQLIPFDDKWRLRDVQGLGGYKALEISPGAAIHKTAAAIAPSTDPYQLTFSAKLKGGIDWTNPYYKVELVRDVDPGMMDMSGSALELRISPLTDTMDYWQKPFRARIGLIDINENLMLGPNISLSEGLSSMASLDVSVSNPIPKGLVFDNFDPEKVKSVVINFEASHGETEPMEIKMHLMDLFIKPLHRETPSRIKKIDFSGFSREPSEWDITSLLKEHGGFLIGINYPFPVVDVPERILEVPQIYPPVGRKVPDPKHFGFSSPGTKKVLLRDLETFAENDLTLVRILLMGHLEGVFNWDEKGRDILGFIENDQELLQKMAGMPVEDLAGFLNDHEKDLFPTESFPGIPGLQQYVMQDLIALLDAFESIEKNTGIRLRLIPCLYDFLLGDGRTREGPLHAYAVGEHPEVVLDPLIKVKAQSIVWKMLKEWSKDDRFYRYVPIMEIMNEPANATALSTKKTFNDLVNFIGESLYLTKDAIGHNVPVSVGFRSWPADLAFWSPIEQGIDILMIHYWESLESYNINIPGLWPLKTDISTLWKHLGGSPDNRLTAMGEIGPKEPLQRNMFDIEKAGYDFSLLWSYSGHDSYDVKQSMNIVANYQKGNRMAAEILKHSYQDIENAFRYLINVRGYYDILHDAGNSDRRNGRGFISYVVTNMDKLNDSGSKRIAEKILDVSRLKGIPLSGENLKHLYRLLVKRKQNFRI